MTDYTPILSLPQVASNQEQKEATINTAIAILEAAMNDSLGVDLSAGNLTLNTDQFTKYFLLQFQGHTVPRVVQVPATPRWFAIENQGTASVTIKCLGSTGLTAELPSGKIGLIVSDGVDLRFVVPDAVNGMGLLADLSDVSGVPTDKQLLRWNATESNWMPWTLNLAFSELSDFPGAYLSYPGSILAVNDAGTGLVWTTSAANVNSFTDLDDTPGSYTGAANRSLRVNNAGTGIVFATPNLRENSDFPGSFFNSAFKFLRVNALANAVEFANPKVSDLSDGPGQPDIGDALLFVRVNAAGTGLEYVPGAGGPVNFTELLDTPGSFTGAANRVVRVGPDADRLIYSVLKMTDLSDFPVNYIGQGNKWLRVNGAQTGVTFADPKVIDLSDGPGAFTGQAKKFVRVNASANALEYYAPKLVDLSDFPANYTGQGGKFLQVRPGEDGVRFVASAYSAAFLDLTDTPDLYTGQAGKFVAVNPAGDGLIFKAAAVNLNDLLDVDVSTGTPAAGSVLTYNAGAWTAEALPAPGATNLNALTDVDLTTGTPAPGSVLTYRDGAWTAEPSAAAGVTYLAALQDVDFGSGEPAEGMSLVYRSGAWSAETLATGGGSATSLGELDDVDLSTGTPTNGQVLTYNNGAWTAEDAAEGGFTIPPEFGAHSRWRVLVDTQDSSDPSDRVGLGRLEFRASPGGPTQCVGGTALGTTAVAGTTRPGAFDTDPTTAWGANFVSGATFIGYQFAAPVTVQQIAIESPDPYVNAIVRAAPASFRVQYSDDGVTWITAWTVTGSTGWAQTETRTFSATATPGIAFRTLADTPSTYVGQAGKALRVSLSESGIEFYTPPVLNLNDLGDVDVDTTPAVAGSVLTLRDGAWTAEVPAPSASTLDQLTDVSVPAPASGEVLTYLGGEWVAANPGALGVPAYGSYPYWRLLLHTTDGGAHFGVQELEFKNTKSGGDLANGGTPFASSEAPGQPVTGAFDNVIGGRWDANTGADGEFIGYHFTAPVEIRYVTIKGAQDEPNLSPASFSVQYSDDGVTYTTAWEVTGQTGWAAGQTREFHGLLDLYFTDLADVPQSFVGQGGKSLRVNTGGTALELYTPTAPPSALNDLTDVDVDTTPAVAGSVLTYRDGAWTAEIIPLPALTLNDLTDVDVDTTPITNGEVLTYRDGAWTAEVLPAGSGGPGHLYELADVYILEPGPTAGQTLVYRNELEGTEGWYPADVTIATLDAVGDVNYAGGPVPNQVLTWVDTGGGSGEWQPMDAQGGNLGLNDLYDVELGDVAEGYALVYRGGQWIAANVNADYGKHTFWRVYVTQTVDGSSSNVMINDLAFRAAPGAATQTTGGTPIADSGVPAGAFDADPDSMWQGFSGVLPQWIGYEFPEAVSVLQIAIRATLVTGWANAYLPRDFAVQFSDDGTTWFDAWTVEDDAPYAANEVRTNTSPGVFTTFLSNTDTPDTYVGQGGKTVRVKADATGLEFVTVSATGALNDLTDVDLTTGTPTEGSVLTYKGGVWSAELPTGGSGGGAVTFGSNAQTTDSTWTNGYAGVNAVTVLAGQTLDSICFEPLSTVSTVQLIGVLYADNAGLPGALIGQSAISTGVTSGATKVLPLGTPFTATVDTIVWVGFQSTVANFQIAARVGGSRYWSDGDLVPSNPAPTTSVWSTAWTIYARGTDAGDGEIALDDLSNVDLTTGTPAAGSVLTYRDGVWTAEPAFQLSAPAGGKHAYWRLNLLTSQGSAFGVAKLVMAALAGGVDQATGGTPLSTNDYTAGGVTYDRFKAFDNDASTFWTSNDTAASTIGYQFTAPVAIGELRLTTRPAGSFGAHGPTSFNVQWSDDGSTWTTAWTVTTPATWAVGETRNFVAPMVSISPEYDLDDLTDVNLTVAPTEGQVLTFVGGQWIADDAAAGGTVSRRPGNRGVFGDTSVYLKRVFETGMPAGFEAAGPANWSIVAQADPPQTKVLKSPVTAAGASTQFSFAVNSTPARNELRVRYRVSSESNWDKFRIYVDGAEVHVDSGVTGNFTTKVVTLTAGPHSVTFHYSKDGSGDAGTDDVVISYVDFAYTDPDATYIVGDVVTYMGNTYTCLIDNTTQTPGTGSAWASLGGAASLGALSDVTIVDPTSGDVLTYDDGVWKAQPAGGSISIGDLTLTHGSATPTALEPSGSLYLRDAAGEGYISNSESLTGPDIVQVAHDTTIGDSTYSVTFTTAPVEDNWLVAFISTNGGVPTLAAGWTMLKSSAGIYTSLYIAYRKVLAGDTTTISVGSNNSGADPMMVYEIKNLGETWADFYDDAFAYGDSVVMPPFDPVAHTIAGPHGFAITFINQRATLPTASPTFSGDWVLDHTYTESGINRQAVAGHLPGKIVGDVVQVEATLSPDASYYGYGVVYFKGAKPYGAYEHNEWNKILLADKASLNDLGDVAIGTPATGEVLTWDTASGMWISAAPTSGLSGVGAPTEAAALGTLYSRTDVGQAWVSAAPTYDTTKRTYSATGAQQTYTVTEGISAIEIAMWGGAGGGGVYSPGGGTSGAGGYTTARIPVVEGDVIALDVGRGGGFGVSGVQGGPGGWPDGGFGGLGDVACGGGGGSSRVWKNGVLMAVAGAGGGGSGYSQPAGAGGGLTGQDGPASGGSGGSQTQGGVDLSEPSVVAKQGGYLAGGKGTTAANNVTSGSDDGAGGGGGYYGGGGGGGDGVSGGGGSGYLNAGAGVTGSLQVGSGAVPAGSGNSNYAPDIAVGRPGVSNGSTQLVGGHGRIALTPVTTVEGWLRLATTDDLKPLDNLGLEDATLTSNEGAPTQIEPKGSLYIDETTGSVWQSGGGTAAVSVVQSKITGSNVAGSATTAVTLSSPPTAGNWLMCLFVYKAGVSAAPGWTLYPGAPAAGAETNPGLAYKKVGVGESATQTPYLATQAQGASVVYELQGGGDNFAAIVGAVSWQDDTTYTTATDDKGTPMSSTSDSLGFLLATLKPWYTGITVDTPWTASAAQGTAIGDDRSYVVGTATVAAGTPITPDTSKSGETHSAYTAVLIKTEPQAQWSLFKPTQGLDDLIDVTLGGVSEGEVLTYTSGQWRSEPAQGSDLVKITNLTANRTLVAGDRASALVLNSSSDTVVTVPLFSSVAFAEGASITVIRRGDGLVSFQPAVGVTILYPTDLVASLRAKGSAATLLNIGVDTWSLFGDLSAV